MLFNSSLFVFVYLPLLALGFYLLGRSTRSGALLWLTVGSLLFYAWWRPVNVLLIAPSILINYGLAHAMRRLQAKDDRRATALLVLGIAFNVAFLGYFKYRNFFLESVNFAFDTRIPLEHLILPLGISFITFQKIAFLVDVHGGRVDRFTLREYFLFVLFFPQLIAGPIVHYRELVPQFRRISCRFEPAGVSLGLTLFVFGLFKKVVLADGISPSVTTLFQQTATNGELPLVSSWMVALGYTLQIYFDFSGYSDMALGLGRIFGIRLPANFDSPLRATNIIDFWRRWHITLTRFLTAYVYNPLVLAITRRRMAAGKPLPTGRSTLTAGAFVSTVAFPTMLVMFVSGVWHGAGIKFIVWGLLHGVYLCINHAWRSLPFVRARRSGKRYQSVMAPAGFVLTFVAVVVAMVFFGAPTMAVALDVLQGMSGHDGIAASGWASDPALRKMGAYIVLLLGIALMAPNSLQILGWDDTTATGGKAAQGVRFLGVVPVRWESSVMWAGVVAVVAAVAIYRMGGPSEFLYWQF